MSSSSIPATTTPSGFDTSKIRDIDGTRGKRDTTEPSEKGRSLLHPFRSSKPSKRDTTVDSGIGTDIDDGSETVQSDSDESSGDRKSITRKIKDKLRRKSKDTDTGTTVQSTEPSPNTTSGTQGHTTNPESTWSPPTVSRYTEPEITGTGYQVDPNQTHCWTTANGESHVVFGRQEKGCTINLGPEGKGLTITYIQTRKPDGGTKHTVRLGDAESEARSEPEPPRTRSRPREETTDTRETTAYSQPDTRSVQSASQPEPEPKPKRKQAEPSEATSTPATSRPTTAQTETSPPPTRTTTKATETSSPADNTSRRNTDTRPSVDTNTDRPRKLQKKSKKTKKTGPSAYDWLTNPNSRRTMDLSGLSETERIDKTLATLDESSRALHSMYQFDDPKVIPEMSRWLTDTVMHDKSLSPEQEIDASQGILTYLDEWADKYGTGCTKLESSVNPYIAARSTATDMTGDRKLYSHTRGQDGRRSTLGEWLSQDPETAEYRLKKYLHGSNHLTSETGPSLNPAYHSAGVSRWVDEPTDDNWRRLAEQTMSLQSGRPSESQITAQRRPMTEAEEDAEREAQLRSNMEHNRKVTAPQSILKKGRSNR